MHVQEDPVTVPAAAGSAGEKTKIPIPMNMEDVTLEWLNTIFTPYDIHVEEFTFEGDAKNGRGFLSNLTRIKMQVRNSSSGQSAVTNEKPRAMNIILKSVPNDPQLRDYILRTGYCQNELQVYTKILPDLEKFLDSRGVSKENHFAHPKCYYGAEEVGHSNVDYKFILVLEDLVASEFHHWAEGVKKPLDWNHAAAAVRQIALFHAASIAYKSVEGLTYFKEVYPCLLDPKLDDPQLDVYLASGFATARRVLSSISKVSGQNSGSSSETTDVLDCINYLEKQFKLMAPEVFLHVNLEELNCIRHSDLHINNVHFKEGNDDNVQAKWFDFQACLEGRPMLDLGFFIILCCDPEWSTTNLNKTLSYYYEIFMSTLREAKVELDYPFERLQTDFSENRLPSVLHIISGAPNYCNSENSEQRLRTAITYAYKVGELEWPRKKKNV